MSIAQNPTTQGRIQEFSMGWGEVLLQNIRLGPLGPVVLQQQQQNWPKIGGGGHDAPPPTHTHRPLLLCGQMSNQ